MFAEKEFAMHHALGLSRAPLAALMCATAMLFSGCAHVVTPAQSFVPVYKLTSTQISWSADNVNTSVSHRGKLPFSSEELLNAYNASAELFKATAQNIDAELMPKLAAHGIAKGGETTLSITAIGAGIQCDEGFMTIHLHKTCRHPVPNAASYRVALLSNDPNANPSTLWSVQLSLFLPYATSKHAGALSDKIIEQLDQSGWLSGAAPVTPKNSASN
jgi:hypothetical protein